ncbi:hypothetical protein [Pseudonocardia sp. H11422]|uniref:hypothetical protein n=1 Tax=Pseudonocardia sp. H11422 TaxID=2835866 RepID=UPI001BDD1DDC|nr:hypothetical protein [Pseudonocardia sp. H11422]
MHAGCTDTLGLASDPICDRSARSATVDVEVEDDVPESYEEHQVADVLCMEPVAMSADDERFDAKTTVLIEKRDPPHRRGGAGVVPADA